MTEKKTLMAGCFELDITPSEELSNYNGAVLEPAGKGNSLNCQVLCLHKGDEPLVIIACDLTFIDRSLVLKIRDECRWRLGLNPDRIMVAATHTHNAPAVCTTFLTGGKPDPIYRDHLVNTLVMGVDKACKSMRPARIRPGVVKVPDYFGNRRLVRSDGGITFVDSPEQWGLGLPPEGPTDSQISYLAFEETAGRPFAFLLTIPCHNNCCDSFGGGVYHSDFFGYTRSLLRENKSTVETVIALPAPSGNLLCKSGEEVNGGGEAFAWKIGRACSEAVLDDYSGGNSEEVAALKYLQEVLVIPDRGGEESTVCDDGCRGTTEWELEFARLRYEPETAALKRRDNTSCLVEINALRIGNTAIVSSPAELFVEYGLEIQSKSPFPLTLVLELVNGYCGYVPTQEAFQRGGYETHRTVYTSRLAVDAGERIVKCSLQLLDRLW